MSKKVIANECLGAYSQTKKAAGQFLQHKLRYVNEEDESIKAS